MMTSKQRMLAALSRQKPDHLPVTTHHVMPYFLDRCMQGITYDQFFDHFGLDAYRWLDLLKPNPQQNQYFDPGQTEVERFRSQRVITDQWRITSELVPDPTYKSERFYITTPKGTLTTVLQSNDYTTWVAERLIKNKRDIDLVAEFLPSPICDVEAVNKFALEFGERGLVRSHFIGFDLYGQPGTWQDAACLYGIDLLIMETFDDPQWVHEFLTILQKRKLDFARSLSGAHYDLLELGGGDASSTVISPQLFDEFVAPYDAPIIAAAHRAGQRVVYHTCGGMMPMLEHIAAMQPDAMETFTPVDMGGDVRLAEAKERIGEQVCMIGGFDQFHFFKNCSEKQTRDEVRRCFTEAGKGGGFMLSPSDHFFDADLFLLQAFADEARHCIY